MALLAMMMPIMAGKKEMWQEMIKTINDPAGKSEADKIREDAGVHERTFIKETPMGDFVILTYEGDNIPKSIDKIFGNLPPEFTTFVKEVHGMDVSAPAPPLPRLAYDSRA